MQLISIHTMDPRGQKIGGIETHVRQLIRRHPGDMRLIMAGVDDTGTLTPGRLHNIEALGRRIDFLPVLHAPPEQQTGAAGTIKDSLTFRFAKALFRHLPLLRRVARAAPSVVEVERFELSPFARALGAPVIVLVHNEGDPNSSQNMDSALKKHPWVHNTAERLAYRLASRIFCVTPKLRERLSAQFPHAVAKAEVMSVSVDTAVFQPRPYDFSDGRLHVIYAGRLDAFKDPPFMFTMLAKASAMLNGALTFHYCGASEPARFAEFAAIAGNTQVHGPLNQDQVAAVMARAHVGVLTSHFEGMPCFLLELLASGRPFGGTHLPQYEQVVRDGVSGQMAGKAQGPDAAAANLVALWRAIESGAFLPERVATQIAPFTTERQLQRLFDTQRALALGRHAPAQDMVKAR